MGKTYIKITNFYMCMDLALCAVALSLALITLATVAGYYEGTDWDTISDMITRSSRLRNAFALIVGVMIVAQAYYCLAMIRRWEKHGFLLRMEKVAVWFGMALSFGGAIGFAIVSTDIAERQHLIFAAVSFSGTWLYMSVFFYVAVAVHFMNTRSPVPSLRVATCNWIIMTVSGVMLAAQPFWRHYAEYVYVVSLHAAALSLCVSQPPTKQTPAGMHATNVLLVAGPIVPPIAVPPIVMIERYDGKKDKLAWVSPALQWSQQDKTGAYRVSAVSVSAFRSNGLQLQIYDKEFGETMPVCSAKLTQKSMEKVRRMARYYDVPFY